MARPDPEKLAQALRTNLRRRKSGAELPARDKAEKVPETAPEKPRPAPRPTKA